MNKFLLLFLILASCQLDRNYGNIYFFDVDQLTTTTPLGCIDVKNQKGIRVLNLNDKPLYALLNNEIINNKTENSYPLDIRYRLELLEDTICIDYNGYFVNSKKQYGKISIRELNQYIMQKKHKSNLVGEDLNEPWNKK